MIRITKKIVVLFLLFLSIPYVLSTVSCAGEDSPSSVEVSFFPQNGAIDKITSIFVTISFSDDVKEPESWTDVFTLKKNNDGSSFCESVVYDPDRKIATCYHSQLDVDSSYTISVSGLLDSENKKISDISSEFQTSETNMYACVDFDSEAGISENSMLVLMQPDYPSVGKITIQAIPDEPKLGTYIIKSGLYKITMDEDEIANAYIKNGFAVYRHPTIQLSAYCVLIAPTLNNVNYLIGTESGTQTMLPLMDSVSYAVQDVDLEGFMVQSASENINIAPTPNHSGYTIAGFNSGYNSKGKYFSQQISTNICNLFSNENGYSLSQILNKHEELVGISMVNSNSFDGNIPNGISVGDVYNGYYFSMNGNRVKDFTITVKDMTENTISLEINSGGDISVYLFKKRSNNWPNGFYWDSTGNLVIRIFDSNGILLSNQDHSGSAGYALAIK